MQEGLQVYDENGKLLIDSNLINYYFVRKGEINIGNSAETSGTQVMVTISEVGTRPMIFIRDAIVFRYSSTFSGGLWTIQYIVPVLFVRQTLKYYVFDCNPVAARFGIETYDADGNLTFSSARKPLKLAYSGQAPQGTELNPYPGGVTEYSFRGLDVGVYAGCVSSNRIGLDIQGDSSGSTYLETMSEFVFFKSPESFNPNSDKGYTLRFDLDGGYIDGAPSQWGRWFQRGPSPIIMIIDATIYDD